MEPGTFPLKLARPVTAEDLAEMVPDIPVSVLGNRAQVITAIAALDDATEGCLTFCDIDGPEAAEKIAQATGAIVVTSEDGEGVGVGQCIVRCTYPRLFFVRILDRLFPRVAAGTIDPTAKICDTAVIGAGVSVGPQSFIGRGARVGNNTVVGGRVHIEGGSVVGERCWISDGCSIGIDGVGYVRRPDDTWQRFPHLGRAIVGSDVEIGQGALIMRGILKDTRVADGVCIGAYSTIGHNCSVGRACWISVNVTLCGSSSLGEAVRVGVAARISNRVHVGERDKVGIGSVVVRNVRDGHSVFGNPAKRIPILRMN